MFHGTWLWLWTVPYMYILSMQILFILIYLFRARICRSDLGAHLAALLEEEGSFSKVDLAPLIIWFVAAGAIPILGMCIALILFMCIFSFLFRVLVDMPRYGIKKKQMSIASKNIFENHRLSKSIERLVDVCSSINIAIGKPKWRVKINLGDNVKLRINGTNSLLFRIHIVHKGICLLKYVNPANPDIGLYRPKDRLHYISERGIFNLPLAIQTAKRKLEDLKVEVAEIQLHRQLEAKRKQAEEQQRLLVKQEKEEIESIVNVEQERQKAEEEARQQDEIKTKLDAIAELL